MIQSKQDYQFYLQCDKIALNKKMKRPRYKHDIIWSFQRLLRKCEYINNCKRGLLWKFIGKIYKFHYVNLSQKLGFSIPFNTFGPGLSIAHYGYIVVNQNAKIAENCRIHEGVTIGATGGTSDSPIIGNNVFIGTGAKVLGGITIADGVSIGANAVVIKDVLESNITVGGIPAEKISNHSSDKYVIKATEIVRGEV